jgi:hypothetical protein
MHAFRLILPIKEAQARLIRILNDIHFNPTHSKSLLRMHNQVHAVQKNPNAVWGTPDSIIPKGLTDSFIHLTEPFHEYMLITIQELFTTEQQHTTSFHSSSKPLKQCNILSLSLPPLRITMLHSAVIIQGIGEGELMNSDRHFEELMQHLIDLRTELRLALLMALHPRLGANASLGRVGPDLLQKLCA